MCGIIGVASKRPVSSRAWVAAGRDAMRHRGPDDEGEYWAADGRVGFGHRRLSIIDLSAFGHQPMRLPDGQIWLTFNGEIYNHLSLRADLESLGHSFRSHSDTEVVLAAYRQWGDAFVMRLDGMFAIALHDVGKGRVILARDRAGEKPLFYRLRNGELRFASELKGLFADPEFERVVDPDALDCYLALGFVPGERCILKGISKLPPAHMLMFDLGSGESRIERYWSAPEFEADPRLQPEDIVSELERLLEDSVRRQMIADVPVGILLSGGVDSSLITALAARQTAQVRTFTVGFPQFSDYDESEHAALVAGYFGTDHTVLKADEVDPDIMETMARQYDEPMIDSSMIPTSLLSRQIRTQCKVALGGDGGDEMFGGYTTASRAARLQQLLRGKPGWTRRLAFKAGTSLIPEGYRARTALRLLAADMQAELPPSLIKFDERARAGVMKAGHWKLVAEQIRAARVPDQRDAVQRMTRFDFENYMVDDILVKVDRASMLHSLEIRAPFLDRAVLDFAFGKVPSSMKATPGARKIILRALADRILPKAFDSKRKQGFTIPLDRWLSADPWRARFQEVLLDPSSIFAPAAVKGLFRAVGRGRMVSEQIFGLVLFELWRRHYRIEMPALG